MYMTYYLDSDQLDDKFTTAIKSSFPHQQINITVYDSPPPLRELSEDPEDPEDLEDLEDLIDIVLIKEDIRKGVETVITLNNLEEHLDAFDR